MKKTVETAAALLIGNELLSGKVRDENLFALARALRGLGVRLTRASFVADEPSVIQNELNQLRATNDVVFTSGGVGPTHDDVTLESVAAAFGVRAVQHPKLAKMLREFYKDALTEGHLRMALVPEGAKLLTSDDIRWPTVMMGNVWVLPGVPEIFRMKLAVLREHLTGPRPFYTKVAFTLLDEGALKEPLDTIVAQFDEVEVGSYPKLFDKTYRTKVTFDGCDSEAVERALQGFCRLLPEGEPQRIE